MTFFGNIYRIYKSSLVHQLRTSYQEFEPRQQMEVGKEGSAKSSYRLSELLKIPTDGGRVKILIQDKVKRNGQ
jgi:hypothetical protein